MRYGILGTTRAWRADGNEVPLGGPARRALLALLLLRPGEVLGRDRLVEALYGERALEDGVHALHAQVSRLRREGVAIELVRDGYRLAVRPDDVDAHRFRHLAEAGRKALDPDAGDPARAAGLLREALALWRGPAVADLDPSYGAALEERRLGAIEDRIEADLRRGRHREVVAELTELVGRHPLREGLHGRLMRALRADGRPGEALAAYESARRILADELGADPSPELAGLHEELLRGTPGRPAGDSVAARTRPGRSPHGTPGRPAGEPVAVRALPGRLTSFVGRDRDVARVSELLASARLVTLLGPGGAGKTSLAVEVARTTVPASTPTAPESTLTRPYTTPTAPDASSTAPTGSTASEVVLVELAGVVPGTDLARTALAALGVRESGLLGGPATGRGQEGTTVARLEAALRNRPALLVLDNCEHVVHDAAVLAERLLSACPALRVLATSREPLALTAEHLWPVRPLSPSDAVRLFTDRARAVRPGYVPDEAAGRICAALDGLPLAIELAAARLRTHEAGELAGRLAAQDRFRLLSRGSRTAEVRHQTLRAVVAWSWDLLTEQERAVARRLTVFSGGATARAAVEVCGTPDAEDVLDSLADKSLLEVSGGRYRMLETIRAFCAEQLGDEEPAVRRAHARYFLELAERADPELRGAGQLRWLEVLAAEHGNLAAASRWAAEAGEVALGMRLLAAQSSYQYMRGTRTAAKGVAAALLAAAGPEPDPELGDAYVLCLLAALTDGESPAGDPVEGRRDYWERHRSRAERMIGGTVGGRRYPMVTYLWPIVTAGSIDPAVALTVLRRAERSQDTWERTMARFICAYPRMAAGEFASAEVELTGALDAFRALGDRWGAALALDGLAWLAATCGDDQTALARTDEALALAELLGAREDLPDLLCNRGDQRIGNDPAGARADYERAAELARRVGLMTYLSSALRGLGDVAAGEGRLEQARELYEQALRHSDPLWVRSAGNLTRVLVGLGRVAEADGDRRAAKSCYERAVSCAVASGALAETARAFEALAGLAFGGGARDAAVAAATLLGAAVAMRGVALPEEPEVAGRVREVLGEREYTRARRAGARLSHREALALAGVPQEVIDRSPLPAITALAGDRTDRPDRLR
ncbi:BTAD domain-containing putative transcriptional regulator [Nonomuraea fuscirosea]|uniref:AfsR/SARP family transcriptional regulator n=1 Tax=Nonomuraea fuscirosea TaxID=1291556 RepID=UPI003430EE19